MTESTLDFCYRTLDELAKHFGVDPVNLVDPFTNILWSEDFAKNLKDMLSYETWYILYDGDSVDGLGTGTYCGRTTDKDYAKAHWEKCRKNPYSIGRVEAYTYSGKHALFGEKDWSRL